jgi:hypothetical protein
MMNIRAVMMKKIGFIVCVALFAVGFPFQGGAFTMGDINSDNRIDMTEAIHALQVVSDVRTAASAGATINVAPDGGMTIQQAIDAAAPGDTINVAAGAYTAALTIKNKALTIQGAGAGTTTITGISDADVLAIDQCRGVIVSGVTLTGGENGIIATRGSVLEAADAVVRNTTKKGILIQENSTARLKNVTVQAIGITGNGATFVVTPNTNKDIQVTYGSRASVPPGSYSTISCSQSYNTMGVPCP